MAPEREFRENSGTTGSSSRNCGFLGTAAMLLIAHRATQPPRPRAPQLPQLTQTPEPTQNPCTRSFQKTPQICKKHTATHSD